MLRYFPMITLVCSALMVLSAGASNGTWTATDPEGDTLAPVPPAVAGCPAVDLTRVDIETGESLHVSIHVDDLSANCHAPSLAAQYRYDVEFTNPHWRRAAIEIVLNEDKAIESATLVLESPLWWEVWGLRPEVDVENSTIGVPLPWEAGDQVDTLWLQSWFAPCARVCLSVDHVMADRMPDEGKYDP